ncbi:MAG: hypothetical protein A2599_03615 [Candidatus Staskawiczbacteria bacterium RIFOXYD1_FULL_39_28]|uniref:peptide chain release factor N(5)-glutamine methyltransferase n=1 Tax=Candidatus Staskawiczbacteria bacterium RIFOXYC1_FULL_38_18 TaxID=1802229 RepID=A0A1G2JC88_9BACT|nr:MAG: hypothetical protein A2401_01500 [Candidatus Staskawiczbacteria bacterium RIFOXYC1_FULL_38_18]OGZ91527.1 MAG: hypothetical protein A2599_03615 [Candidatus Staskawiczbacteria bacterium RIFOXYD1_FULL_39_28]
MLKKEINWLLKEKYLNKPNINFKKDIKRLEKGEPLDYVIGFTDFLGCKIDLSKKPLIPRPETEFWVGQVIKEINKFYPSTSSGQNLRILDMFSGSGCIGLAVLKNIKNSEVDFADIENRMVGHRVIKSDVFSNIKSKYDYIFANPPYIPDYRKNLSERLRAILLNRIQKSVLKFEPKKALFGGKDGLFYINKFLKDAPSFAKASDGQGKIFMEFSPEQKDKIERLLKKYKYKSWEFNKDQYGKWRWVMIE